MLMASILLTGASGQVGWELARTLMPLGRVIVPGTRVNAIWRGWIR